VHEGNVVVHVLDDGAIRFTTPNGKSFDSTLPDHTQPLADWHQLVATHEKRGLNIDRHTAAASLDWVGYDHGIAVDSLLRRARDMPPTREPISS
jgi:hypothetical protein